MADDLVGIEEPQVGLQSARLQHAD